MVSRQKWDKMESGETKEVNIRLGHVNIWAAPRNRLFGAA